jgi:hypothetical protein
MKIFLKYFAWDILSQITYGRQVRQAGGNTNQVLEQLGSAAGAL